MRGLIGTIPWPGKLTAVLGAIVAGVCSVLGGWTPAMTTLVTLAALDVVGAGLPVPDAIRKALAQLSENKIEDPEGEA